MKLYHGTTAQNAEYIEAEGFIGGELDALTIMRHVDGGVVYLSAARAEATEYGEAVFEIDFDLMDCDQPVAFSDGNTDHFYSPAENINQHAAIKRLS